MAYIRAKIYKRKHRPSDKWPEASTYYYVVQSYRVEGKVRQATLAYLGEFPTVEQALAHDLGSLARIEAGLPEWETRRAEIDSAHPFVVRPRDGRGMSRHGRRLYSEHRMLGTAIDAAPGELARLRERIAALLTAADALGIDASQVTANAGREYKTGYGRAVEAMLLTRTIGRT